MRVLAVMCRFFLLLFSFFIGMKNESLAQASDTIGVTETPPSKYTKTIAIERQVCHPEWADVEKVLKWQWQCMGPIEQPAELNPGGKAIPNYAVNRGNGTGRINYLHFHPKDENVVFACSPTGGLWYSENGGDNWIEGGTDRLPISGVSSVAADKKNKRRWWIATGDGDDVFQYTNGVWMTSDKGRNYVQMNGEIGGKKLPFGGEADLNGQISDIAQSPRNSNLILVASNRGLFISNNAKYVDGIEWEKKVDGWFYDLLFIKSKRKRDDVIFAAGAQLVRSSDQGKSWDIISLPQYEPLQQYPFLRLNVERNPLKEDEIFVVFTCSKEFSQSSLGEGALFVYNYKNDQWKFIRSLKKDMNNVIPTRARAFGVHPINGNIICGNVQPLYISENSGVDFKKIEKNQMHDDCHHILFSKSGKTVFASHDGGVSKSADGGLTWKTSDKGIGAANIFGVSTSQTESPYFAYGGYDVGGNYFKEGKWYHVSWGDGFESIVHPENPNIVFTTMQNGNILKSVDGNSFEQGTNPIAAKTEWHSWIKMHPVNHNMIFCAGEKFSRSTDLGQTWQTAFNAPKVDKGLYNVYRFFLSEQHPGVAYLYVLDTTRVMPQIWKTLNITADKVEDIKWEKVKDVPIKGWIMSIQVDPIDPNQFWLLYGINEPKEKFWRFDGTNYYDETANLGWSKCESMILQRGSEGRLYIGSNYGVFTKRKNESKWTLMTGLPGCQIKSLAINYRIGKLVVGTYGRGVWQGDLLVGR